AQGRVRRLSHRRRHQQALSVQNPGTRLRPSPGDGLPLPRPPAGGCVSDPRLARHRVRGGGSMNVPLPKVRMNVDEFLAWSERQPDDRYELVDGEIVAVTRDTIGHDRGKFAACLALYNAVRAAKLPCYVFIDGVGVKINEKTLRIPDIVVHCGAEL